MDKSTTTQPALSDRLCVGPAGLLRFNASSGHFYPVTGLRTYDANSFIHFATDALPMPTPAPTPPTAEEARAGIERGYGWMLLAMTGLLTAWVLLSAIATQPMQVKPSTPLTAHV